MLSLKIKSIKKLNDKRHVYDLSVVQNHNFFVGNSEILTSNCDFLSQEGMAALRSLLETYSLTTRFILTCNYVEKIISPLVSRCQTYEISPMSKKDVAVYLKSIFDKESVDYTLDDIGYIINNYYPDIRKVLNYAQQSVLDGKVVIDRNNLVNLDVTQKIINNLKEKTSSAFASIRQLIADSDIKQFDEYYRVLYDKSEEYAKDESAAILIIAEYMYQSALVVDKEITFMACIARLIKDA